MITFKKFRNQLNEYAKIGGNPWRGLGNKAVGDAEDFAKSSFADKQYDNYKLQITPKDLRKHSTQKLSNLLKHKAYTMHHVRSGGETAALLYHKKDGFVGSLLGSKTKKNGVQIHETFLTKKHRGKGLGVAMYENAVKKHGGITSDSQLSNAALGVYKHFAKKGRVSARGPFSTAKVEYDSFDSKSKRLRKTRAQKRVFVDKKTGHLATPILKNLAASSNFLSSYADVDDVVMHIHPKKRK